ncbi:MULTISPECIES: helix-turn-helix domain-containing protein [Streptomyces]|uniref:Helix-turn-helix domain-containing protein n=2 Tax=Streptomyces rimosus TaxID=1927 RepID=A0A8A1UJY5_STRR1|nr:MULTISPECIES: helix-turn-helix domain-containing protein [Streptomyces]QST80750.1 helix-turn-helix domain-containing protein [Streptomyces rimosus subsp. rimosus ATCC 10970]
MTWAMDDAPMLRTKSGKPDTTARHVLQALAEHANKNGRNAHPSLIRLQYRTGYDRRTVQRALRRLQDAGLIVDDGRVQDRTRWKLALHVTRPASDWEDLERAEEEDREATAARVRKHRSKKSAVTDAEAVTETDADDVTEAGVTDSASVRNALEVRYVTHSASVCNALSAALTTNQPSEEPPATPMAGVGAQGAGPLPGAYNAPIDDAAFTVTDSMRRWAHATYPGLDIEHSTAQFVSHYRSTGARRHSWPDAWQKWIRDDARRVAQRHTTGNVIPLPTGQALTGTDARVAGWLALPTEDPS